MNKSVRRSMALLLVAWFQAAGACTPPPAQAEPPRLQPLISGIHTVAGEVVRFNPCHRSVSLRTPFFVDKPPLMIVVHGGGGLDGGTQAAADAFRSKGMATLVFDAFQMNGFEQGSRFFASAVTNEARQRMIYRAALGAYEWALRQDKIDTRRILFHGLSNGAAAVANLAAVVDPEHVVALIAEGTPGNGLGLPDDIKVPLKFVFGRLDNYGGRTAEEFIWLRQEPCIGNVVAFDHPKGNSAQCNRWVEPDQRTQKPIDWYEAQKAKGAPIELWWLERTAHGVFIGPLLRNTVTYSSGSTRMAWVGGDWAARSKFLDDVAAIAKTPRP
ncbi:MAG: hypothetical protein RL522_437 [Pseudomonadota bacterium]|jgi:hypothetical protein